MSHKTDATLRPFLFAFPHCAPFPHGYTVSRGVPVFPLGMTECVARNENFLSITCPKGKYHCNAISLSKTISRQRHITAVRLIAPKVRRFSRRQKHRVIAYYFVFIIYNYFYYYISKNFFENVCFLLYKTFFIWYYPFITLYYAKLLTR